MVYSSSACNSFVGDDVVYQKEEDSHRLAPWSAVIANLNSISEEDNTSHKNRTIYSESVGSFVGVFGQCVLCYKKKHGRKEGQYDSASSPKYAESTQISESESCLIGHLYPIPDYVDDDVIFCALKVKSVHRC